jgi:hypothetical protein
MVMIRPAERFAVNIRRHEPIAQPALRSAWVSFPMVMALAAILGAGLSGIMPAGRAPTPPAAQATLERAPAPAAIEPAAGPANALDVTRAPDRRFYAPVLFDRVPVTMELAPQAHRTLLAPGDAGRLSVGRAAAATSMQVEMMELGPVRHGPVVLQLGPADATTSVLGADLLDRLAVVAVEGERLRLTPR